MHLVLVKNRIASYGMQSCVLTGLGRRIDDGVRREKEYGARRKGVRIV